MTNGRKATGLITGIVTSKTPMALTEKERHLIQYMRQFPFGEFMVIKHDGEPRRIERALEKVQL